MKKCIHQLALISDPLWPKLEIHSTSDTNERVPIIQTQDQGLEVMLEHLVPIQDEPRPRGRDKSAPRLSLQEALVCERLAD